MNMKFVRSTLTILLIALTLTLVSCNKFPENGAAVVNGETVLLEDVDLQLEQIKGQYVAQGMEMPPEQLEEARASVLDQLITQRILVQKADELGYKGDEEKTAQQIEQFVTQMGGQEAYEQALVAQGLTVERFEIMLSESLQINDLLETEVYNSMTIEEEELLKLYEEMKSFYKEPEQVAASHILISFENRSTEAEKAEGLALAQSILATLQSGADFAETAREKSEGPSGPQGGSLGLFTRGQMVAEFEEAAFAMSPGEISGIVETQFGYHIIKVTDFKAERQVPYEEAKTDIENYLREQKGQESTLAYIDELKASAEITYPEVENSEAEKTEESEEVL